MQITRKIVHSPLLFAFTIFTLTACGGGVEQATKNNRAPIASNDVIELNEDESVTLVGTLDNDQDADGHNLTLLSLTAPVNGTLSGNSSSGFTYAPANNFFGEETLQYVVTDGHGGQSKGSVTLKVVPVNDPPETVTGNVNIAEETFNTTFNISALGLVTDIDSDALTFTLADDVAHGLLTLNENGDFLYTAVDGYQGEDTFVYSVSDGQSEVSGTIVLDVTNTAPVVRAVTVSVNEDSAENTFNLFDVLAVQDAHPAALHFEIETESARGVITQSEADTFSYSPHENFFGTDRFSYIVKDGAHELSGEIVFEILPVNDAPVANSDLLETDRTSVGYTVNVLSNDVDIDSESLFITEWTDGANGTVKYEGNGVFSYIANSNTPSGNDTFAYTISDGAGATSTAEIHVTINSSWGHVERHAFAAEDHQSVIDEQGNVTLVWRAKNEFLTVDLWGRYFDAGKQQWEEPALLSVKSPANDVLSITSLNTGRGGNVVVTWRQFDGSNALLFASRYKPGSGWSGSPTRLTSQDSTLNLQGVESDPKVVADLDGNVALLWLQNNSENTQDIWTNQYSALGDKWGTSYRVVSGLAPNATLNDNAGIAIEHGEIAIVWLQSDATTNTLNAIHFDRAGGDWYSQIHQVAQTTSNPDTSLSIFDIPLLHFDNAGNLVAIWQTEFEDISTLAYDMWANTYSTADASWGEAQVIETTTNEILWPVKSFAVTDADSNKTGEILVVWAETDNSRTYLGANVYDGSAWLESTLVSAPVTGKKYASLDSLSIIPANEVLMLLWKQSDTPTGESDLWANHFNLAGQKWVSPSLIENAPGDIVGPVKHSTDKNGNITAVWLQDDSGARLNVRSNRYSRSGDGWAINASTVSAYDPATIANLKDVALDFDLMGHDNGDVSVVWRQRNMADADHPRMQIWSNHYQNDASAQKWQTASLLKTTSTEEASLNGMFLHKDDTLRIVWGEYDGQIQRIHSRAFENTNDEWLAAREIQHDLFGSLNFALIQPIEIDTTNMLMGTETGTGAHGLLWTIDYK